MPGRNLGDAYIVISPDTRLFGTQTDAQVRKALAAINPNVRIGADTKGATAAITAFQARVKALSDTLSSMRISADTKGAEAQITGLQGRVLGLAKQMSNLTMAGDTTKLDAQIAGEVAKLKGLQLQMSNLQADADTKAAAAKIAALEKQAAHLQEDLDSGKLVARVDIADAEAKLESIDAQLRVLSSNARAVKLAADSSAILAQIAVVRGSIASLQAQARDIQLGVNIDPAKLLAAEASLLGLEAALEKLTPAVASGDTALGVFGRTITGAGRGWGILTGQISLFGGVFNRVLPVIATSVAVWHVLTDAIIEVAAVWIPATLAVGAFAAAASDAAVEIVNRMIAVHTVMDATGQSIPPMTRAMENLHDAVRPDVYQLFGDALTIMNSKTGEFQSIAKGTGTVVDQLAARITFAVTSGKGFGSFMGQAVTDVSKLGDSIGNIFGIFGNFFKVIPGFATGLLTIGDDFTKILESATAAAEPILRWVLLLHGYILYTGLAASATLAFIGGVANLARQFVTFAAGSVLAGVAALKTFGTTLVSIGLALAAYVESIIVADGASASFAAALAPLAANPMIWVTAAAVALGALVVAIGRSKDAAQQFNATMQQTIANAQLSGVVTTIQDAQTATAVRLAEANKQLTAAVTEQGVRTGQASRSWGDETAAVYNASKSVQELTGAQKQLADQQQLVTGRVSALSKEFGSNAAALGILNAAGITSAQITDKNSEHWAQALIQIHATVAAYQAMGTQAGTLGNDLDVLGRTVTDQYAAIQKLNQGWSAFISDVTSSQGSFDTVAQGFFTLEDHSSKLNFSLGKLKVTYADANVAIDSLTPAGIALNQAFGDQIVNVDKLFASWRTAGLAGNLFTAGVKDSIAPLTKYANGSREATAQLVALAQEAGYQGPISMAALTKWLGNTHDATQNLKDITNQATEQEALLTGAMQDQGTFISQQLLNDINQAIIAYDGVGKAASAYGTAVAQFGKDSSQAHAAQTTLITDLVNAGGAAGDTKNAIAAMVAKVLGIPQSQALKDIAVQLNAATNAALKSDPAFHQVMADFTLQSQAANSANGALKNYNAVIAANGINSDQASLARLKLVNDMEDAGVKAKIANTDVDNYTKAVQQNGLTSDQANKARQQLVTDILNASANAKQGRTDLANYTKAVEDNGSQSNSAQSARATLIKDLVNAGLSAKGAKSLVDNLQTSIDNMHGKNVTVGVSATASGTISILGAGWAAGQGNIRFHSAAGGLIDMGTGPTADDVPAMLSKGEYVIKASSVAKYGKDAMDRLNAGAFARGGMIRGYADGGFANLESQAGAIPGQAGAFAGTDALRAVTTGVNEAMVKARAAVLAQQAKLVASVSGATGNFPAVPGGGNAAANMALAQKMMPAWASGTEWGDWRALWTQESGWNQFARNPNGGAYGIPQALPPGKMGAAANPPQSNAGAQIGWGISYIRSTYGDPIGAWAHEVAHNWYKHGGLVPGYAAGGSAASLRSSLAKQQAGEKAKYFGLSHSFAAGPAKYRTKATVSELHTLAARQASELAAYKALSGSGLTSTHLTHLGATARAESRTASDQALNRLPGGHPGFAKDLRKYLSGLSSLSGQAIPGTAGSTSSSATGGGTGIGTVPGPFTGVTGNAPTYANPPEAAWLNKYTAAQKAEYTDWAGLWWGFLKGPAKYRTAATVKQLQAMEKRQYAEELAYAAITQQGLTPARQNTFRAAAISEYNLAYSSKLLSRLPGGHPGFVTGLRGRLSALSALAKAPPAGTIAVAPGVNQIPGEAAAAIKLGPVTTVPGGVLTFDKGGYLPPRSLTMAWNGTSSPEPVGAAAQPVIKIEIGGSGNGDFDAFMLKWVRQNVRVHGGGSVQSAFGRS